VGAAQMVYAVMLPGMSPALVNIRVVSHWRRGEAWGVAAVILVLAFIGFLIQFNANRPARSPTNEQPTTV
jgi:hypothetical protein